ncbi:MAG TPA: 50S ribosomal protein L16 [Patescibacteria group bacterium]|nr:50S ribosomal protein L16 [Patescibacteria group bacterium]
MLMPKKVKYRRQFSPKIRAVTTRGATLSFGKYGLKSQEEGYITARQIEAGRRAITRFIARGGKLWIRIFPDRPKTKHAAEAPMGSGKGSLDHFVANVEAGRILFELDGIPLDTAKEALRLAAQKMSVKTKFIHK